MFEHYTLLISLTSAIGATLAGIASLALYKKQSVFQTYQIKRHSLQDFKNSDIEDCKVQLQQFLLGDYFLSENGQRYSLKELLSEYEVFNQASESNINLIANNRRVFKQNTTVSIVEKSIHQLIERILRQLENLAEIEVDEYEYLDTANFLLNALKGLEHCGFGTFDSRRQCQLSRIKVVLRGVSF
jgi:hypothetical protein